MTLEGIIKKLQSKFLRNIGIYAVTDVVNKLVPFILLPILTRYLTPTDYGMISMFTVFVGVLGVFISLETHTAIGVNFFKKNKEELRIFISNVLLIITAASFVVLIFTFLFEDSLVEAIKLPLKWLVISVLVTLFTIFTTINIILWQSEERAFPVGIYRILQTLLNFGLTLILVVGYNMDWEGRLIASATAALTFGCISFGLFFKREYINFKLDKADIKSALGFGVPLLPHAIGVWIRTGVDRLFLTMLVSTSATGLYTVGYQIASVILVITIAFNKAYTPYLYKQLSNFSLVKKKRQVKYSYLYMLFLFFAAGLLSLLSPYIIEVFIGEEFVESRIFVSWFAFGFALFGINQLFANYVVFSEKTSYMSYVTTIIGLLHVLLCYFLVKEKGAIGAAQAFTIVSFIDFVVIWVLSNKIYPMPWFQKFRVN